MPKHPLPHDAPARCVPGCLPASPSTMQGCSLGARSQQLSNGMNAPKEASLQSQTCSSHPVLQHGVCCAAEDAALWGSCLSGRKAGNGERKFKICGGMGIYGGHGIWGRLGRGSARSAGHPHQPDTRGCHPIAQLWDAGGALHPYGSQRFPTHTFWAQDSLSGFDDIGLKKSVLKISPPEGGSAVAIEQRGL